MDVFPYFTVSCYKGFGDDPGGFYAVYSELFKQLATEDIEFMESPEEFEKIPKFGTSTSNYEEVVGPFYAYWQSYCTKKTYAWLCPHNVHEYRDRRILREIEKETKKIAQKAKKERNDEIRALVAFVRKRDKRVLEYKRVLEEKAEQNRVKQQMHRLQQLKRNQEEAEAMRKNTKSLFNANDHEEQLRQMEQAYGSDSSDESDEDENGEEVEEEEEAVEGETRGDDLECDTKGFAAVDDEELLYVDDLYCVACNKAFKNYSSYDNHESSKKHRDNIDRLKKKLQAEEKIYEETQQEPEEDSNEELPIETDGSDQEAVEVSLPKQKIGKKGKRNKNKVQQTHVDVDEEDATEIEKLADVRIGHTSDNDDSWADDGKKGKKGKNRKSQPKGKAEKSEKVAVESIPVVEENTTDEDERPAKKESKSKAKKVVKEVRTAPADMDPSIDISHTCVTCTSTFDSKNKLFDHLKKTKHGVYLPKTTMTTNGTTSAEGGSKKGKKK